MAWGVTPPKLPDDGPPVELVCVTCGRRQTMPAKFVRGELLLLSCGVCAPLSYWKKVNGG